MSHDYCGRARHGENGERHRAASQAVGLELILWNRTQERARSLNLGPVARAPVEAAQQADVVLSILTGPEAVRDVYFGPHGVFEDA